MSVYRNSTIVGGALLLVLLAVLLLGCTPSGQGAAPPDDSTATAQSAEQETASALAAQEQVETAVALTIAAQSQATQTSAAATERAATSESAAATENAAATESAATTAEALLAAATATQAMQATETTLALSTARAEQAAEATAVFVAIYEGVVQEAQIRPPIYGPASGDLPHEEDDFMETSFANVNIRNFVVEATFILDPSARQIGSRDFGFLFRAQDEAAWCLAVKRSGEWELIRYDEDRTLEESGRMATGITGTSNTLTLYVDESEVAFLVNGQFISVLPLTNGPDMGDIAAAIGVFYRSEKAGETTRFEDFTIWPVGELPATPLPVATQPRATTPPPGFDPTALVNSLNNLRVTIEHMGGLLDRLYRGESQSCQEYLGYYQALQQRPTYANLPVAWQGIYGEYNFAAENILSTNNSIKTLCESGGGYVNDFDYGIARQGIAISLDRINQAIQAANQLLNQ